MNKWIGGLAMCLALGGQHAFAEHKVSVALGNTDFNWKEFKENINGSKGFLNEENGDFTQLNLTYGYSSNYQNIAFTYSTLSGGVDYAGLPASGSGNIGYTITDYDMQQITGEYGAWFNVDYIKPYAAIFGGYHQRERIINESDDFSSRLAEEYTFYFWGVLLEAEVFNWNNLSFDVGGKYTYTVEGKNHLTDFGVSIPLKAMSGLGFYARANYNFLPTWEVSLELLKSKSKMDKSVSRDVQVITPDITFTQTVYQPESEQEITSISLSLSKTF